MKIIFRESKISKGTIGVSLDGGANYTDYEIADILENGILLNTSQSFDQVIVKGHSSVINNVDVVPKIQIFNGFLINTEKYGTDFPKNVVEVVLPDNITKISEGTFKGYEGLTKINIPDSVTIIDSEAFYDCINLKSINIPDGVTTIGMNAFRGCKNLTDITISNSVNIIGPGAFTSCLSLTDINIPTGLTYLASNIFNGCSKLVNINIPNNITYIEAGAFK
jgi:hypothetical protein